MIIAIDGPAAAGKGTLARVAEAQLGPRATCMDARRECAEAMPGTDGSSCRWRTTRAALREAAPSPSTPATRSVHR